MDAASVWPTRQIRRDAAELTRIISVVKIKMMGNCLFDPSRRAERAALQHFYAAHEHKRLRFLWRPK